MSVSASAVIVNPRGLHARAAAKFVALVQSFDAKVAVSRDAITVDADSIMEVLMLAAPMGTEIEITTDGPQANEALAALIELVNSGFGEA